LKQLVIFIAVALLLSVGCSQKDPNSLLSTDITDGMRAITVGDLNQPLEQQFNEILPSSQNIALYYDQLEVMAGYERPRTEIATRVESTFTSGDTHMRIFDIEYYGSREKIGELSIALFIDVLENEDGAIGRYQYLENSCNELWFAVACSKRYEPLPEAAFSYGHETDSWKYNGPSADDWIKEGIVFRVDNYLGWFQITEYDPPTSLAAIPTATGIYQMSFHLTTLIDSIVQTTITNLQAI
jgi:hypothetical protein